MRTFGGRDEEDKRRQKGGQTRIIFSKLRLLGAILKKSAHSLFGAWSSLLVHVQFTPSEGPKGFIS